MTALDHLPEAGGAALVPPMEPVPVLGEVSVLSPVRTHAGAADYGAYTTVSIPASTYSTMLLPYDENRKVAWVLVTTGASATVYIGTQAQVQANPQLGFPMTTSTPFMQITHKQEVWIGGDGSHAATVALAIERWKD